MKGGQKKIPYGRHSIDRSDCEAVLSVLKSDWLTQGPKIFEFESALAKYAGAKYAVAVTNGTAALHLAYLVAGLKSGDEVITTPNTFVATTNMLLAVGAKPVFCDIRLDTYNIDEDKIEELINSRTKAIVPVHFAGNPCNMKKIMEIAKKHKLVVIEDACHALGAHCGGKPIGGIGDISVFSFHPVKSITTAEGGAIVTNNIKFYRKLLKLRSHGVVKDKNGLNVMEEFGWNYRMTDISASLGLSQLDRVEAFIKKREKIASLYTEFLRDNKFLTFPTLLGKDRSSWHIYVVRTNDPKDRLPLYNFLKNNGVMVNFHYPAVYSHPYYRQNGYGNTRSKNADIYSGSAITLPIYPDLSIKDVNYVVGKINEFFSN